MVQLSEIRKLRKKDEASVYIQISREIGLVLTWIILNVFPSVSANAVTISMLVINLVSIALLFKGILHNSLWLFISSFLLFNFSIFLDCVDGNIARFRQQQSVYGVFLDRLVHNVSYPLLFFVPGIAVLCKTSSFGWFLVFFLAGIMTEL